MYETIDPKGAYTLMQQGHPYIDVRTEAEFAAGHPEGAVNVPIFTRDAVGQMLPNTDFLAVIGASFQKEAALVLGCQVGGRSARACEVLASAGYTKLHNVAGGWGGARDPSGRAHQPGWQELGLPASRSTEGVAYADLKARLTK